MQTKNFIAMKKLIIICLITLFSNLAYSQNYVMNEDAKRYFSRAVTATQIAKSIDDYKNALTEYQKAVELCSDCAELYYKMGLCCEVIGKDDNSYYSLALKYFQKGLTVENNVPQELKELIKGKVYSMEYAVEQAVIANRDMLNSKNLCGRWIFHASNGDVNELYDIIISENHGFYSVGFVFLANYFGTEDDLKPDDPGSTTENSADVRFEGNVVCFSTAHIYALFAPNPTSSEKHGPQSYHNRHDFNYELRLENGILKGVSKCTYHFEAMGHSDYSTVIAAFRDGYAKVFSNCKGNCGTSNVYFTR